MIRKHLKNKEIGTSDGFRIRGSDNTRIEALSDAVFAIAIALMLISSSIPETFSELLIFLEDFVPFAATITLLILIWYEHYIFFLRYGLTDPTTVVLNTVLLFMILFYVYPLKFLFKVLYSLFYGIFTGDGDLLNHLFSVTMPIEDAPTLMVIYGLGAFLIFFILSMMYLYAYKIRERLELNQTEVLYTKLKIFNNLISGGIPLLSVLVAFFRIGGDNTFTIAGFVYWLYAIVMPLWSVYAKKKLAKANTTKDEAPKT